MKGQDAKAAVAIYRAEKAAEKAAKQKASDRPPSSSDVADQGRTGEEGTPPPPAKKIRGSTKPTARRSLTSRVCAPAVGISSPPTPRPAPSSAPLPPVSGPLPAVIAGPSTPKSPGASLDVRDLTGHLVESWNDVDPNDLMPFSFTSPSELSIVQESMRIV